VSESGTARLAGRAVDRPVQIELSGLVKSFKGPRGPIRAVRGIDVEIAAGETVALLGPNGAGKSTTIDMLLGLLPPDEGAVSVFGRSPSEAVAQGAVGAMLQTGALIRDLSVRELVTMMASLYPAPLAVEAVLELTGIGEIADQRTHKLSGGQTQRVRFAVALVSDPELLVLDEPTVAMDVEGRHAFWASMREFAARGRTIVFATHYLEEADANADRAVLMAHGRIVADGPTTEIKAMVGTRTIRATLPEVDIEELARLPGVGGAERRGESVVLNCADSDAAIRALLASQPQVRDIEIASAGLEQAFLALTAEDSPEESAEDSAEESAKRPAAAAVPQGDSGGPRRMSSLTYTRYELLRTLRNRRFFFLSLGFPLVLFFLIAGPNRNVHNFAGSGLPAPLYYMIGLASFGTMSAMLGCGARIAAERAVGWNRQLRITPLSPRSYFRAKILTAYMMALLSLVVLYAAGASLGVSLQAGNWLKMTGLILIGLVPFAALGILLGHMLTPDSIGPAMGGGISLLALLGGAYFPIGSHGFLHDLAQYMPSYWLVQASHVGLGGAAWTAMGWTVMLAWTVVLGALAARAYRRDTGRV
jgi:ABC-2 type transport system ATP-binding protein